MIEFQVYSAKTVFNGPPEEEEVLYRCLRVRDKNSYFRAQYLIRKYGYMSEEKKEKIIESVKFIRFYDARKKTFGSGLLSRVKKKLKEKGIKYKITDNRKPLPRFEDKDVRFRFKDKIEARPEQIEVLRKAVKAGSGILAAAVNFGKSEIAAALIDILHRKTGQIPHTLFLVHRISLVMQTAKRFEKHLGIKVSTIGGGQKNVGRVTVATVQTAYNLLSRNNKEFLDCLHNCELVILDELHLNKARSVQRIMENCRARMRYGLSGTISKKKVKLLGYMAMTGPIVAEVQSKELIDLGRSARPTIRLVRVDEGHFANVKYASAYRLGIMEHVERNKLVVKEALRYLDKGMKNVMVTVARISHGHMLQREFENRDLPCEYIHGGTPQEIREKVMQRFARGKTPVMIASPILNEGVDLPEIRSVVLAGAGKSWEQTLQRVGRALRRKEGENRVYLTDFLDFHNQYLLAHSLKRFQHYRGEEYKMKIITPKEKYGH